jgi:hypothetical protein
MIPIPPPHACSDIYSAPSEGRGQRGGIASTHVGVVTQRRHVAPCTRVLVTTPWYLNLHDPAWGQILRKHAPH